MANLMLWVIADALLYVLLIIPFYFSIKSIQGRIYFRFSYRWEVLLLLGCLVFCLYNKTEGDYFHYNEFIQEINSSRIKENIFEPPFMWLISIIGNNYFLFRLLVWGTALFLYVRILKYLHLYNNISVSVFILFVLLAFAYGRVCLALSIFYLGAVMVCVNREKKEYYKVVIGWGIIFCSLFFHKSIFVPVLIFGLLYFVKLNWKWYFLAIILCPIVALYTKEYVSVLFEMQTSISQLNRGIVYLSMDDGFGLSMIVPLILSFPSYILLMMVMGKSFFKEKSCQIPFYITKLYEITFFLIILSFMLLLVGTGARYLFLRIKEMSYIPFSIFLTYYLMNFQIKKWVLVFSMSSIFMYVCFYFLYAYYLKSIGTGI